MRTTADIDRPRQGGRLAQRTTRGTPAPADASVRGGLVTLRNRGVVMGAGPR